MQMEHHKYQFTTRQGTHIEQFSFIMQAMGHMQTDQDSCINFQVPYVLGSRIPQGPPDPLDPCSVTKVFVGVTVCGLPWFGMD